MPCVDHKYEPGPYNVCKRCGSEKSTKSPGSRKSAERQRRKDAGEMRIECWVSERDGAQLKEMARDANISVSYVVTQLLAYYYS